MKKLLILPLGLAFFAACSTDASGPKDREEDEAYKTRDSFCKAWGQAACNDDVVDSCQAPDKDTCIAQQKAYCANLIPVGYVNTFAEDCLAAVKRAYSDAELNKSELDLVVNLGSDCSRLVRGPSGEGDSCQSST